MGAMLEKIEKLQEQMKVKQEEHKRARDEEAKKLKTAEQSAAELKKEVSGVCSCACACVFMRVRMCM